MVAVADAGVQEILPELLATGKRVSANAAMESRTLVRVQCKRLPTDLLQIDRNSTGRLGFGVYICNRAARHARAARRTTPSAKAGRCCQSCWI